MANSRSAYNAAIVGLFGFLLYLIITINNHRDEAHSKELLTNASIMAKSSQEVDSALAMLKEVQLLGYCDDDCKVLFGKLLNRKGEWSSALKHCSEVVSKRTNRDVLLCLASSHMGLGNTSLSLEYLSSSLQVEKMGRKSDEAAIMQLSHFNLDMQVNVTSTVSHDIAAYYANYTGHTEAEARNLLSCGYVDHLLDTNNTARAHLFTKKVIVSAYDAGFDEHVVHSHFSVWLNHQAPQEAVQVANFVHFMLPKKSPRKVFSMKMYGEALLALNTTEHTTRAIEVLLEARHLSNSSDADVFLLLSRAYEAHEDLPQSAATLETALKLMGDVTVVPFPLLIRLSRLQLATGQYQEMLETLSRALLWCDGSDVILSVSQEACSEAHLLLGKVRHRLGMTSAAIKSYYKACVGHSPWEKEAMADLMDIANNMPPNPAPLTAWKKKSHQEDLAAHSEVKQHQHQHHSPEVASVESAAASVTHVAVEEVFAAHKALQNDHHQEQNQQPSVAEASAAVDSAATLNASESKTVEPSPVAEPAKSLDIKQEAVIEPAIKPQPVPAVNITSAAEEAAARARSSALQYLQTARAFYDKGWLDKALVEINKALRKVPDLIDAFALRGEVYADLDKTDEAIGDLSKVYQHHHEQNPDAENCNQAFSSLLDLALKLSEQRRFHHSAAAFKVIRTDKLMNSQESSVWFAAALAFGHSEDYSLAIIALDAIPYHSVGSGLSEDRKKALLMKSDYYDLLGMKDKAEAVRAEVMQASETWQEKGDMQLASGLLMDAAQSFENELRRLQDLLSNEGGRENNNPKVLDRLKLDIGEVHQKLGKVYSELSKKAAETAVASLKTQVSAGKLDGVVGKQSQEQEKLFAGKAHSHYLEAMERGQYDLDMRRFFSSHPLPESMRVAAVDATNTATPGGAAIGGSRNSQQSKTPHVNGVDGAGQVFEKEDVVVEPLPSMRTRHRWVVRHLVDPPEVVEAAAGPVDSSAKTDAANEGGSSSSGRGLGGSSRMNKT